MGTWGPNSEDERKMDAHHRSQLKYVMCIKWEDKMSNKEVYEKARSRPITIEFTKARWKMFGNILGGDRETPAFKHLKFYFEKEDGEKYNPGQERPSLISAVKKDMKQLNEHLEAFPNSIKHPLANIKDLMELRNVALNIKDWEYNIQDKIVKLKIEKWMENNNNNKKEKKTK